ncbi:LemA family protein [Schleiferilactobacillus harbinensis]|uniref:LemA family protein n=1 Tax=Schleiferilactobacillus harbinensis TaxID=304207 RepID=A0A5P8M291_9LACO|nr:LemA family protein [Schleiferilactobacillus harbinensis]QFR22563.1 LemA family protein [Schleiferilactobacillus harbinensis]
MQNGSTDNKPRRSYLPWLIVLAVIVVLGIFGISTYNGLAKQSQSVDSQWANVETVMQRRADLIPNLVSAVKGSMKQEQKVFGNIAAARSNYSKANSASDKMKANAQIDQSVGTLISAIHESYPQLESNNNVKTLMTELEGTENRIAVERRRYNTAVQSYNTSVVTFPRNVFANMTGQGQKPYFKAETGADKAPKVDLDDSSSSSK